MSDNPKPYIGIKLSKTPESPESIEAQEEAIREQAATPDETLAGHGFSYGSSVGLELAPFERKRSTT